MTVRRTAPIAALQPGIPREGPPNGKGHTKNVAVAWQEIGKAWVARGVYPVPLRAGKPVTRGWTELRIESATDVEKFFPEYTDGIGVLLGLRCGEKPGLMDVDLDCNEARTLAPRLLPSTRWISGRKSNPASHYFYSSEHCSRSERFEDPQAASGKMLVELRGAKSDGKVGFQAIVPPSTHSSGEIVCFKSPADDPESSLLKDGVLREKVAHLAAATLLVRYWPSERRHKCMLALAGTLAGLGWKEAEALNFAEAVYSAVPSGGVAGARRIKTEIRSTFAKYIAEKPTTGIPSLTEILGETVTRKVLEWLSGRTVSQRSSAEFILRTDLLSQAVEKAETILAAKVEYKLYRRGNNLVRVVEEDRNLVVPGTFFRPNGNTYLARADATSVEFLLSKAGIVFKESNGSFLPADPLGKWGDHIISRLISAPDRLPWKYLDSITNVPFLRFNGDLVETPGYDPETGVWLDPQGRQFPAIPPRPTIGEARQALDLFEQVFLEFPFAKQFNEKWNSCPAYATVLATIFSILLRHLLPTVPLLGISAPEPGSGKTKIAEAIGVATTGCLPSRIPYDNTEEFDKQLPIPLVAGDRMVLIDNVDHKMVNSARLSMVLSTEAVVKLRILGETRDQTILNRSVFIATGNHLILSGDLPRRSLLCRLDPNVATPETRSFSFDPVTRAKKVFPELAMAALTAARYYLQANCPPPSYEKNIAAEAGSFTEWNRIVRGLLVHLGFGDPLSTQQEVREENPLLEGDIELAHALNRLFSNGKKFSARSIQQNLGSEPYLLLSGAKETWDPVKVGFRLRGLRDRVLDGLKVETTGRTHGVAFYRVIEIGKGGVGWVRSPLRKIGNDLESRTTGKRLNTPEDDYAHPTPPLVSRPRKF
jgi:hypothetical protein